MAKIKRKSSSVRNKIQRRRIDIESGNLAEHLYRSLSGFTGVDPEKISVDDLYDDIRGAVTHSLPDVEGALK